MYRPIENDARWTITQEYTGKAKPQFVVRFCDEWVGSRADFDSAVLFAVCERDKLLDRLIGGAMVRNQ